MYIVIQFYFQALIVTFMSLFIFKQRLQYYFSLWIFCLISIFNAMKKIEFELLMIANFWNF